MISETRDIESSDESPEAVAEEYCRFVDRVYGMFLDATFAMGNMASWYMDSNRGHWKELEQTGQELKYDDFNPEVVYSGSVRGDPGDLHRSRLHDVIARNVPSGGNWHFLALMCVVGIYSAWEDHFRARIAAGLGLQKKDLKADVFGEVGALRHSIVHRRGFASDKVAKAKLTKAFPEDEPIKLEPEDLHEVALLMQDGARMLSRLSSAA